MLGPSRPYCTSTELRVTRTRSTAKNNPRKAVPIARIRPSIGWPCAAHQTSRKSDAVTVNRGAGQVERALLRNSVAGSPAMYLASYESKSTRVDLDTDAWDSSGNDISFLAVISRAGCFPDDSTY